MQVTDPAASFQRNQTCRCHHGATFLELRIVNSTAKRQHFAKVTVNNAAATKCAYYWRAQSTAFNGNIYGNFVSYVLASKLNDGRFIKDSAPF